MKSCLSRKRVRTAIPLLHRRSSPGRSQTRSPSFSESGLAASSKSVTIDIRELADGTPKSPDAGLIFHAGVRGLQGPDDGRLGESGNSELNGRSPVSIP